MVVGGSDRDTGCLSHQMAGLFERPKLMTNRRQSAKRAQISGLIGEDAPIGLFGGLHGESAGNGDG